MNIHEFDVVSLQDGRKGTVLALYQGGAVLLVEICDEDGKTLDTPFVSLEDVASVIYRAQ